MNEEPTDLPNHDLQAVVNQIATAVPNTVIGGSIGPGGMRIEPASAQTSTTEA